METVKKDIGEAVVDQFIEMIEEEIEEQQISISELARRAHTARPYLHRVLSRQHVPSIDWCGRIAEALGLELTLQKKTRRLG